MRRNLTRQDKKRIVAAITKAEMETSGEIRVHLEHYCPISAYDRAVTVFNKLKMFETKDRNAVLIYVALESRKFAIIGDSGIHAVVSENYWTSVRDILGQAFASSHFALGICCAVMEVGDKLKMFFPYNRDDVNELPNEISYGNV